MRASFIMWNIAAQTAAGFADEIADGAGPALGPELAFAEIQQAVRRPAVAHLVIEPGKRDVVALAEGDARSAPAPSAPTRFFGTTKSEMPFVPGGRLPSGARDLRQHQVDDVFGQLVLAGRDPHLVAASGTVGRAARPRTAGS